MRHIFNNSITAFPTIVSPILENIGRGGGKGVRLDMNSQSEGVFMAGLERGTDSQGSDQRVARRATHCEPIDSEILNARVLCSDSLDNLQLRIHD